MLKALWKSSVPVPEALCLCEDATVLGTPFYVMRYLKGRIFVDITLPDLNKEERTAIYADMAATLAKIHSAAKSANVSV